MTTTLQRHPTCRTTVRLSPVLLAIGMATLPLRAAPEQAPTASEIKSALENHLLYDSAVPSNGIDINVSEGIATLSGGAPSILAKERAAMIAESIRGVRSVINHIRVEPVERIDQQIRSDIESALLTDPATEAYEVETKVSDGVATLGGTVQSWAEKQLSGTVAKGVKGLKDLKNQIEVTYETDRPDEEISAEIRSRIDSDIWVDDILVTADVEDGVVSLSGTVGSVAEKKRAVSDAWTSGVTDVDASELQVRPWADRYNKRKDAKVQVRDDDTVRESLTQAFLYDPRVASFNPDVAVRNGVVTLSGVVDNLKARRAAGQVARNTTGVWRVKNHLKVRDESNTPDDELARKVGDALRRDPTVERYEIHVTAVNGKVYLTGSVDSYFERMRADDAASRVRGVETVNNGLSVDYPDYTYSTLPYSLHYNDSYYFNRPPISVSAPFTDDRAVKEDIESEFFWSPFVDGGDITVDVDEGVVTLTGEVDDWAELTAASENAWEGGAINVINKLNVKRTAPGRADHQ